jgi:hypothetical protein
MKKYHFLPFFSVCSCLIFQPVSGAIAFITQTNSGGVFQGDTTWVEAGTQNGSVVGDYVPASSPSFSDLITGFTEGGTLGLGTLGSQASAPNILDGAVYDGNSIIDSNVTLTMDVGFGSSSGTADLQLGNAQTINGNLYDSNIRLQNITGTNSLEVTFSYNQFIHAQRRSAANGAPFLAGVRSQSAVDPVDVTATYNDIGYYTGNPGVGQTWTDGLPSGGSFVTMDGEVGSWDDTASHSWTLSNGEFQGVNAYDVDGGGLTAPTDVSQANGVLDEIERVHASSITFTLQREDGLDFDGSEAFLFSFTGMQTSDVDLSLIPEPSVFLFSFAGIGLCLLRRIRS